MIENSLKLKEDKNFSVIEFAFEKKIGKNTWTKLIYHDYISIRRASLKKVDWKLPKIEILGKNFTITTPGED